MSEQQSDSCFDMSRMRAALLTVTANDVNTGKQLWVKTLGTIQKASPVLADGKLYVGTENGKFYILKPSATGCEILDEDQLGTEAVPETIIR